MADYFTSDHFKLLNKWKDQKRDKSNPENNQAYKELVKAYELTEQWALAVQKQLFPNGRISVRKRPTSQADNFTHYNWARIYPQQDSPKQLAYTVGIGATDGFVVKIDTVGVEDWADIRKTYLKLRGDYNDQSPIVSKLPATDGLAISMPDLVEWSINSIKAFDPSYEDVSDQLGLTSNPQDILNHFHGHDDFVQREPRWSPATTALFIRLARCVHENGFDWYFTDAPSSQLRFGQKERGLKRGKPVGWLFLGKNGIRVAFAPIGDFRGQNSTEITERIVEAYEDADLKAADVFAAAVPNEKRRDGYWPDDYEIEGGAEEDEVPLATIASSPKNTIFYGPPGTGKTYALQQLLLNEYTQQASLLSPEDWQAQKIDEKIGGLTWWEAIAAALHDLDGTARVGELIDHPFVKAVATAKSRNNNIRQTIWGTLQQHAVEESKTVKSKLRLAPFIFDKTEDSIWYLTRDWKDEGSTLVEMVDDIRSGPVETNDSITRYSFVTFHQSYGYEEFVEGLRPVLGEDTDGVGYEIRKGAFTRLCERARIDPNHRYAIMIDEINRGNISKIFGELITLIEPDKRDLMDGSTPPVEVKLAYSGEQFSVPANVDIIGTMNTADRSLALVDTALRRRFDFMPVLPDTRDVPGAPLHGLRVTMGGKEINIPNMLAVINQRIEALYDRDHTIGHAYFTPLANATDDNERGERLAEIFRKKIVPLLEEYFFEDLQKIRLVLADNRKQNVSTCFVTASDNQEADLVSLFGNDHGLDAYATKRRYALQESAFLQPDAYIGIYAATNG